MQSQGEVKKLDMVAQAWRAKRKIMTWRPSTTKKGWGEGAHKGKEERYTMVKTSLL